MYAIFVETLFRKNMPGKHIQIFKSLHSRNYRLYFIGQGISLIGSWMQNIALSWLIYRLTGSVFLLGLIGFTSQIPTLLLTPVTGVVTDRFNRLNILKLTQTCYLLLALAMTLLVMLNQIEVWHIIVLSVLGGVITAFDAPARQSLVINLIDNPDDLGNAIALNSAIFNGARLIGPAVAGVTIAAVGEGVCFLLNTLSFFAVLAALMNIRIHANPVAAKQENLKKSFREGWQYTFHSVPIRMLITLLALLSLAGFSFIVLLPAYAKEILHGSSDTLGYLMSALGAGALLAALYMASRQNVIGLSKILAMNIGIVSAAVVLASFTQQVAFALIWCFFGGLSMILLLSSINTLLQTITDEDKRGRVMSFYAMALMGTTPIGNLIAGYIASKIGIPYTFLIFGVITLGTGVWFSLNLKAFRKYVHPIFINKGILHGLPNDLA